MDNTSKKKTGFDPRTYYRDDPKSGTPAAELLTSARLHMLQRFPFWGKLAQSLVFVETPQVPTTGVDAKCRFYYNPKWVNAFSFEDAVGELCHETGHLYQRLFARRGNRDHGVFNIAADYCIDTHLEDAGVPRSFASKLMVGKEQMDMVHKLKMIEPVYDALLEQMQDNTNCQACKQALDKLMQQSKNEDEIDKSNQAGGGQSDEDKGGEGKGQGEQDGEGGDSPGEGKGDGHQHGEGEGCGEGQPTPHTCGNIRQCCAGSSTDPENASPMEVQKALQNVIAAKMWAESKGNMPAHISEQIDELTKSKVRWQDHLRVAANKQFSRAEYTYKAPNRRGYSTPCRLPSVRKESKSAVITVDTSGSMSQESVIQCVTEAAAVIRTCGCDKLWLILHDYEIYFSGYVSEADLTKLKMARGGTSHKHVFEAIAGKHSTKELNLPSNDKCELAIMFTDLGTDFPDQAPSYPVIWGVPDPSYPGMSAEVPFGKKIPVEL